MNLLELLGYFNYWVFAIVLTVGLYTVIAKVNLVKKLIGLSIFQSAVFLMYITMDKVEGGTAPIIQKGVENQLFSNPLPQVLILTAIYYVRRFFPGPVGVKAQVVVAILFALLPQLSWHSIEARPYVLLSLAFLIGIVGFHLVIEDPARLGYWLVFSCGILLINWSHGIGPVFSALIYLAVVCQAAITRNKRMFWAGGVSAGAVFLCSLPLLPHRCC